jgi:hypothetical protein
MYSKDFLLRDTHGLEQEIKHHCAAISLDCSDKSQVHQFAHEVLQNMEQLKTASSQGDRTARAKVELFGMTMMMHQANIKAFGPNYMSQIDILAKGESAWVALVTALWSELESRNPNKKEK